MSFNNLFKLCAFLSMLVLVPSCKRPYEKLKRIAPTKPAYEKQRLVRKISKEQLSKPVKNMTIDEALKAKDYYEELGREDLIMFLIPHILTLSKDVHLNAQLELEFADRTLSSGDMEKAQKLYTKFVTNYPGDAQLKTARYRQLLATFWMALEPDRDQALTLSAVDFAKKFLQDFPQDTEYTEKVQEILRAAYLALLEAELGMVAFYCNKFSYEGKPSAIEAARLRLQHLKETYIPLLALYDERARTLQESLELIEKQVEPDAAQIVDQAQRISKQVALLEVLLTDPQQRFRTNPRDIF